MWSVPFALGPVSVLTLGMLRLFGRLDFLFVAGVIVGTATCTAHALGISSQPGLS